MRPPRALLLVSLACAAAAWAQTPPPAVPAPLGAVTQVEGLVTMSLGSQVATVQTKTPVFDGARFVSSSSGTLELNLNGGSCIIKLQPNQLVQIDAALTCNQQIASIITVPGAAAGNTLFAARTALPLLGSAAMAAAVAKAKVSDPEITPRPR